MPTSITEYAGMAWLRAGAGSGFPCPAEPALKTTVISSGGTSDSKSTLQFQAGTVLVQISGSCGLNCLFGSSLFSNSTTGGTSTVSSTSAQYLPAGVVHFRGVSPNSKLLGFTS